MLILNDIKKNPLVLEFINQTEETMVSSGYTDHGFRHVNLVSDRARTIANEIGLTAREQEIAAIAAFCHDMMNFLSRDYHNYLGALSFQELFRNDFEPKELASIMQAIANHDKKEMKFISKISAIVVLADKSDVNRSRVMTKDMEKIKTDIHDRVNYATEYSKLKINTENKTITLSLKIDTSFVPIMEYFEIFMERMTYCRMAAKYLRYKFDLVINNFKLL